MTLASGVRQRDGFSMLGRKLLFHFQKGGVSVFNAPSLATRNLADIYSRATFPPSRSQIGYPQSGAVR
jgi:hypothetical protein